jgi:hypothetical protein
MHDHHNSINEHALPLDPHHNASQFSLPKPLPPSDLQRPGLPLSLSVNYLPSKFSPGVFSSAGSTRKRKGFKGIEGIMPKRGGGVEAFKSGEARMPGENDDDYDGVNTGWFGGKNAGPATGRLRWNRFKWALFVANVFVRPLSHSHSRRPLTIFTFHTAHHLFHHLYHFLPPHMVRRLDTCRRHPRRQSP